MASDFFSLTCKWQPISVMMLKWNADHLSVSFFSYSGFERFCVYCSQFENLIPVIFILGFFVQLVVSRWSEQSNTLPYPDHLAFLLNAYVTGDEEAESVEPSPGPSRDAKCHVDGNSKAHRARLIRRTIMRYANLSIVAAFRRVSYPVKKKIPNEEVSFTTRLLLLEVSTKLRSLTKRYGLAIFLTKTSFWLKQRWLKSMYWILTKNLDRSLVDNICQWRKRK